MLLRRPAWIAAIDRRAASSLWPVHPETAATPMRAMSPKTSGLRSLPMRLGIAGRAIAATVGAQRQADHRQTTEIIAENQLSEIERSQLFHDHGVPEDRYAWRRSASIKLDLPDNRGHKGAAVTLRIGLRSAPPGLEQRQVEYKFQRPFVDGHIAELGLLL